MFSNNDTVGLFFLIELFRVNSILEKKEKMNHVYKAKKQTYA